MPKQYQLEKRETFGTKYLKVFLKDTSELEKVATLISDLQSVHKANVTENKVIDITVYPAKMCEVEETEAELSFALDSFFGAGRLDPVFGKGNTDLSQGAYESILDYMYNFGQNLEKFKDLHKQFDEEKFRDFFLPHLNSISTSHTATGETFNKIGKTDILIQDAKGVNVFIGECKVWKGEGELLKAVDQLLNRYVNWRDEKAAIIIFNKEMKKFSELLTKAVEGLQKHKCFKSYSGPRKETSFSFVFMHPDDSAKQIQIELIIFNCS